MATTQVRIASKGDCQALEDLDFETSNSPYDFEQWNEVIEDSSKMIVGVDTHGFKAFALLRPTLTNIEILKIGVHPQYRRKRYGTTMILYLKRWAKERNSKSINILVPETETTLQLFLKAQHFKCIKSGKKGLLFVFRIEKQELISS